MSSPKNDVSAQPPADIHRLRPALELPAGCPSLISRYELFQVLGEGAFGRVYLGIDPLLNRRVAIKTPFRVSLSSSDRESFLREALATAAIHHPNVCPVYDAGVSDGIPFIVMRYVAGGTLEGLLIRGALSPSNALVIARQISLGLAAAHANGVVHRDLKPSNVLVDEAQRQCLIADFGLSRWLDRTEASSGGIKGTPKYMSPEQWGGGNQPGDVGPQSDIYSLGLILFELLTGTPPFEGGYHSLMFHHCHTAPPVPSSFRTDLDPRLDALCLTALEKSPSDRYSSAKDFAAALAAGLRYGQAHNPDPPTGIYIRIPIPGAWYARPLGDSSADWTLRGRTPAEVRRCPNEEYRFSVSETVSDDGLASLASLDWVTELVSIDLGNNQRVTGDGLAQLSGLTALQDLDLSWTDIGDEGLVYLTSLRDLRHLSLEGCDGVTDDGLNLLAELPRLEWLDLTGCSVTLAGLTALSRLNGLRSLDVSDCAVATLDLFELQNVLTKCEITSDSSLWRQLSHNCVSGNWGTVRSLDLSELDFKQLGAQEFADLARILTRLTQLESLTLPGAGWSADAAIEGLQELPKLRSFHLPNCKLFLRDGSLDLEGLDYCDLDEVFAFLPLFSGLKSIKLPIVDEDSSWAFVSLLDLPELQSLHVDGFDESCASDALAALRQMTSLRHLSLTDECAFSISELLELQLALPKCKIDIQGHTLLPTLAQQVLLQRSLALQYLKLNNVGIPSNDCLAAIRSLHRVESLLLSGSGDGWLNVILSLSNPQSLRSLQLTGCDVAADGIAHLEAFERLESVSLCGCSFTDVVENEVEETNWAAELMKLKAPIRLQVKDSNITDHDLRRLAASKGLTGLDISDCHISDVGLAYLSSAQSLRTLRLAKCFAITHQGIADLKRHLPQCDILFDRAGDKRT